MTMPSSHEVDLDALFSLPPKVGQVIVTVLGEFPSNDSKFNEFQFRNRIKPYVPLSLICYTLIATIGLILNLDLIRYIVRIKSSLSFSHRHLYTLLLGNSINDMLIKDVIVLPISYVILTSVHWTLGQSFCRLFPLLQDSCFHVTSLTFLFAFYTRYKHISNAHFNSVTNDVKHVKNETAVISAIHPVIILILCWVISICGVIPHTVFITYIDLGHYLGPLFDGSGVCVVNIEDNIAEYIRFLFALFYLIPIVMTISYHFKCVDIISRWNKSSEDYRGRGVAIVHRGSIVENVSYSQHLTSTTITSTSSSINSDRNHNVQRSSICSINNPNQVPKTKLLLSNEPIDEGDENDGDDDSIVIQNLNTKPRSSTVHVLPNESLMNPNNSQSLIQRSQSVRVPRTTFSNTVNSHVYNVNDDEIDDGKRTRFKRNSLQPTMLTNDYTTAPTIGQQQQHQSQVHHNNHPSILHPHRPSISRQLPSLNHLRQDLSPSSPTSGMTVGTSVRSASIVTTSSDGTFLVPGNARSSRASSLCIMRNGGDHGDNHVNIGGNGNTNDSNFLQFNQISPSSSGHLISPSSSSSFVNNAGRQDNYHQRHHSLLLSPNASNVQPYQRSISPISGNSRTVRADDEDIAVQEDNGVRQGAEEQNGSSFMIPGNSRARSASQSMVRGSVPLDHHRGASLRNNLVSRTTMQQQQRSGSVASKTSRKLSSNSSSTTRGDFNGSSRTDTTELSSMATTRRKSSGFDEFIDITDSDVMSNLNLEESLQRMLLTIFLVYSILLLPLNVLRFTKNLLPEPPGMAIVFDLIFIVSIGFQFMTTLVIPLVIKRTSSGLFKTISNNENDSTIDPLSHLRSSNSPTNYGSSSIMITSNNRFAKNYGQHQQQSINHNNLSVNHDSVH